MRLHNLMTGERVCLIDFGNTPLIYRRRLLSMGITRGVEVRVIRVAPLGCPLQIEVRGISIALRKEEAAELVWGPV